MLESVKFVKRISENKMYLGEELAVTVPECFCADYLKSSLSGARGTEKNGKAIEKIVFSLGIPDSFIEEAAKVGKSSDSYEAYALKIGSTTEVYARTPDGFLRAFSTIVRLADDGELTELSIYDYPASPERGYRCYLPGRKTMKDFLKMVDFLVYYKYNAIILEIGGAMEYERHPKINEKWVEFCADMGQYSGRTEEIQHGFAWSKNSIHYENGDSSYLTKRECRELAEYCRARGIEVIPECPSLSHSDYICIAYPEVAELSIDPYPDTYCPSNPKSYEIVFDILDEVIEVFKPKRLNIGHDEYYLSALCDACKDKDPVDLYVEDVRKISDYLTKKGVKTLMWGEKLVKARNHKGHKFGAWYDLDGDPKYARPNMTACVDKMPKGITYLHWYWVFGTHLDDEYHARNYPAIFGNFEPFACEDFRTRINRGMLGAFVSNWGSCAPEYMQRNFIYFDLVASAHALWSDTYDNPEAEMLKDMTFKALYAKYCAEIKNPIKVRHSTDYYVEHTMFWDGVFIEDSVYCLGNYEITYTDGTVATLPVKYGTNIGTGGYKSENAAVDYAAAEGASISEAHLRELSFSTLPEKLSGGYVYNHVYENPYPEKSVSTIRYIPNKGMEKYAVNYEFEGI